jgi:hypothetical protein
MRRPPEGPCATIIGTALTLEDEIDNPAHGQEWPASALERTAIAAWAEQIARIREQIGTMLAAVDELGLELARVKRGKPVAR